MKSKLITILVSLLCVITHAQEQEEKETIYLKDLEGIWKYVYPGEPEDDIKKRLSYESKYMIIKEKQMLSFTDYTKYKISDSYFNKNDDIDNIYILKVGFVSKEIVDNPNPEGTKWIRKDRGNGLDDYLILATYYEFWDVSKNSISIFNNKVYMLSREDSLSIDVQRKLYKKGVIDKRDYLKEFLDIQMCEVKSEKAVIYSEPDQATKMYLVKYDLVEVLETQSGWVKIKYVTAKGKTIIGWLREEDLDESI